MYPLVQWLSAVDLLHIDQTLNQITHSLNYSSGSENIRWLKPLSLSCQMFFKAKKNKNVITVQNSLHLVSHSFLQQPEESCASCQPVFTHVVAPEMTSHCGRRSRGPANSQNRGVEDLHRYVPRCCSGNWRKNTQRRVVKADTLANDKKKQKNSLWDTASHAKIQH